MQKDYFFSNEYFGLSEAGLHLMRSGFNFETIGFEHIESVNIKKGKSINNWFLLLTFGVILLCAAAFLALNVFINDSRHTIHIEEIVGMVMLSCIGSFVIWRSFKNEQIIEFKASNKKYKYATKDLKEAKRFDDIISFLKERSSVKIE